MTRIADILTQYTPEKVIEVISEHLTDRRKERIELLLNQRIQSIHVAVESPVDIHNALAIVRSSEALGVNNVHIIDWKKKRNQGRQTMKGSQRWSSVRYHKDIDNFLERIESKNLILAGACVESSVKLEELPVDRPICLLFGNEHEGLSSQALERCAIRYTIPMFGMSESFNLSVSAAISLYSLTRRKRENLGSPGDLSPEETVLQKATYFLRSLGLQKAQAYLRRSSKIAERHPRS